MERKKAELLELSHSMIDDCAEGTSETNMVKTIVKNLQLAGLKKEPVPEEDRSTFPTDDQCDIGRKIKPQVHYY